VDRRGAEKKASKTHVCKTGLKEQRYELFRPVEITRRQGQILVGAIQLPDNNPPERFNFFIDINMTLIWMEKERSFSKGF